MSLLDVNFNVIVEKFDAEHIIGLMDKLSKTELLHGAAYTRKTARNSMDSHSIAENSPPGHAPFAHPNDGKGALLKTLLAYAWDESNKMAVIGPKASGRAVVPGLMERGGTAPMSIIAKRRMIEEQAMVGGRVFAGALDGLQVTIEPRPYMGPARDATAPMLASAWEGRMGDPGTAEEEG